MRFCRAAKAQRAFVNAQTLQSLCCSHTQSMAVDEDSNQNKEVVYTVYASIVVGTDILSICDTWKCQNLVCWPFVAS